ncbi:MAG: MBL fold metallo-hydrolase [Opitutae bacterium]|nr:MBL fold metallo-hydrolase [Opitutae bacterium]MBT5689521.1 MBL fold metallo-hydrolase [Opitutae bacterium]MBT6461606.1 MBL fold metallo-hydrolase [Opitutae bacterium]MBT7854437.1 MBL fold metallo-hydrolase [Opitutae bacterium]
MKRILLTILSCLLASSLFAGKKDKTLDVYWVDVEGGAATLVVTPAGQSILIDTGNPGNRDAERIHKLATEIAGLKRIDKLITTHFHLDHFGGAAPLTQLMKINEVYDNGMTTKSPDRNRKDSRWPLVSRPYREMKVGKRVVIRAGEKIPVKQRKGTSELVVTCVAAQQDVIKPASDSKAEKNPLTGSVQDRPEDLSDNANSVATLFAFGNFRFLDCGDLTWNVEAKLVTPVNPIGTVDVYQVNHHGLASSNNPILIRSIRPTVSVMNNGHTKGCSPETFATLRGTKSIKAMYQVHKNLRKDSENNTTEELIANKSNRDACKGHYIKLSVQPDGSTYTLSIPSHGHSRIFKTTSKNE